MLHRENRKVLFNSSSLLVKEAYVKNCRNFIENLCLQDVQWLQYAKRGDCPEISSDIASSNLWQDFSAVCFPAQQDWSRLSAFHPSPLLTWKSAKCNYNIHCLTPSETLVHLQQKWLITFPLLSKTCQFVSDRSINLYLTSLNCYPSQIHSINLARESYDFS